MAAGLQSNLLDWCGDFVWYIGPHGDAVADRYDRKNRLWFKTRKGPRPLSVRVLMIWLARNAILSSVTD
jgi:hypothetical protein